MTTLSWAKQKKLGTETAVTRKWLFLILGLYLILAAGYSIVTPRFEAPDEHHHFFNALAIQQSGQLPRTDQNPGLARQEAAQPPLYYLLAALLIAPVEVGNATEALWPNPYVQLGNANSPDNANAFIHTQAEDFPWQGMALAAHIVRFLSILFGLGTLLLLFGSARLIWPSAPQNALLATSLVAFLPQFGFIHGSITNDTLMILGATAVLYQLLFLIMREMTNGRLLLLGVTLGLALLTKTTGLLLLIWAVGWLVLVASYRKRRLDWQTAVLVLLPALLVGGWWLGRNWLLYGDITAVNQFVALAGGNRHYTLRQIWGDLDRVWLSAIAFFGWMTVRPPVWIQWLWGSIVGLAVGGSLWQWRLPNRNQKQVLLWGMLGSWFALVLLGWLQFMRQTSADQGRLLFPALAALALMISAGLARWQKQWLFPLVSSIALLTTCYCLLFVLPAAYAIPQPQSQIADATASQTTFVESNLGQGIELIATQANAAMAHPGDFVELTFYWRAAEIPDEPPTIVIELFGRDYLSVGKLLSYHGSGRFPANLWQPETIYQDTFWVQLAPNMTTPTLVRPVVHLLDEATSVTLNPIKVTAPQHPAQKTAVATLGSGIELVEATILPETAVPGEQIQVALSWQVKAPSEQSLTTFVHLSDQTQRPFAQADGIPLQGDYPTQYWAEGEQFADIYTLTLPAEIPPGEYPIYVGLYDAITGTRLPVLIDNQAQPFSAYLVGFVKILAANENE